MLIGYARVSTGDQSFDLQLDALSDCDRVYSEIASGAKFERVELNRAIASLKPGDTLKVWRLDRLGRSLSHLIDTITYLRDKQVNFQSVSDAIDTSTAAGRLVFGVFGAIAEFERELIRERTIAGLAAAKARGRNGGRKKVMSQDDINAAIRLHETGMSVERICETLHISRATYYRHVYDMIAGGSDLPNSFKL